MAITNEGVIPTRFTVTTASTTTTTTPAEPPEPPRSHEAPASGSELHRRDGEERAPAKGETTPPPPLPEGGSTSPEIELVKKAAAVGDAGTKYPPGRGAIEVLDGGGELAGYGSAEIVVVFAPLAVGDFRTVKVGARGLERASVERGRSTALQQQSCTRRRTWSGQPGVLRHWTLYQEQPRSIAWYSETSPTDPPPLSPLAPGKSLGRQSPRLSLRIKETDRRLCFADPALLNLAGYVLFSNRPRRRSNRPSVSRGSRRSSSWSSRRRARPWRSSRLSHAQTSAAACSASCT